MTIHPDLREPNAGETGGDTPWRAIRVLLADDHALVRQGIRELLDAQDDFEVVGEAATGRDAVAETVRLHPDVALLDIHMPGGDGLWATAEIAREAPDTRVVILTVSTEDGHLKESLRRGAAGYLLKSSPAEALYDAIRDVCRGERPVPGSMAGRVLAALGLGAEPAAPARTAGLSTREEEVLRLLSRGATNKEIAAALDISENTVKAHLKSILRKLGVGNRVEAAGWALRHLEGPDLYPSG
jgi:NarL family two-component system response regulator LiaR